MKIFLKIPDLTLSHGKANESRENYLLSISLAKII